MPKLVLAMPAKPATLFHTCDAGQQYLFRRLRSFHILLAV